MIENRNELKRILKSERDIYLKMYCNSKKDEIVRIITRSNLAYTYKYIKVLRKCEYYYRKNDFFYFMFRLRKNQLGRKLGIEAYEYNFNEGIIIYHPNGIVINKGARIGKNCKLHGNNCIGNDGKSSIAPKIGNNVDIGVGAKIIGNIEIADNVKIGAGAVVVKSCLKEGATLVGVPAKIIEK